MSKKVVSIRLPPSPTRTLRHAGEEHWVHQRATVERDRLDPHPVDSPIPTAGRALGSFADRPNSMVPGWMDGPAAIRQSMRRTWPKRVSLVHE